MADSGADLLGCLKAINSALLAGDFAGISALTDQMESRLAAGIGGLDAESLKRLRGQASANAVLLQSSQRGLRAAQRRVAEIRGVASGLSTYTAAGRRNHSALRSGQDHRS